MSLGEICAGSISDPSAMEERSLSSEEAKFFLDLSRRKLQALACAPRKVALFSSDKQSLPPSRVNPCSRSWEINLSLRKTRSLSVFPERSASAFLKGRTGPLTFGKSPVPAPSPHPSSSPGPGSTIPSCRRTGGAGTGEADPSRSRTPGPPPPSRRST